MLNELPLDLDAIEEHGSKSDDDHLLVDFVNLREWLQYPGYDFVFDDLFLAILLNTQEGYGSHHITEYLFLFLVVEEVEQHFKESFLAQMT